MQIPADLHQINAQLLCRSQAGLVKHRIQPRGSFTPEGCASSTRNQQQPPSSMVFLPMGLMRCNKDKFLPTHGWGGKAEEREFLTSSPEEFALEDSQVRHMVAGTELQLAHIAQWSERGQMRNQDVVLPTMHRSCSA